MYMSSSIMISNLDRNNISILIEEEITCSMFDKRDDVVENELIEEVDNVQVGDAVVDTVGSKDVESALATFKRFLRQNLSMLHLSSRAIEHFKKKERSWCAQESHQTTLGLCFHYAQMYSDSDIHVLCIFIIYISVIVF